MLPRTSKKGAIVAIFVAGLIVIATLLSIPLLSSEFTPSEESGENEIAEQDTDGDLVGSGQGEEGRGLAVLHGQATLIAEFVRQLWGDAVEGLAGANAAALPGGSQTIQGRTQRFEGTRLGLYAGRGDPVVGGGPVPSDSKAW